MSDRLTSALPYGYTMQPITNRHAKKENVDHMTTKRFCLCILGLALAAPVHAQQPPPVCQQPIMSGEWRADDGAIFNLKEHPDNTVTGTVSAPNSCVQNVPVIGAVDLVNRLYQGFVDLSRTTCANRWWLDEAPLPAPPGCNQSAGTYYDSTGLTVPFTWSKPCDIPTTETNTPGGWAEPFFPTVLNFGVTVSSTRNRESRFGGRTISEQFYQQGFDSCWYIGSELDNQSPGPSAGLLETQIDPATQGYVEPDSVGWEPSAVLYYRNNFPTTGPMGNRPRFPCGVTVYQSISMTCEQGLRIPYVFNVLSATIEEFSVQSCRGGVCAERVWITGVTRPPNDPLADVMEGGNTTGVAVAGRYKPNPAAAVQEGNEP